MIVLAAFALLTMQEPPSPVVWEEVAPAAEAEPVVPATPAVEIPDWARSDPFAYERARCSPLVRGDKPLETCQAETRLILAAALGDALPAALRPAGSSDDCQMMREASGGSAYAVQCGAPRRDAIARPTLQEQDCRPRPDRGGFSSECRPVDPGREEEGLKIRLWGDD